MSEKIKIINGQEVERDYWLRRPFYAFQLWSPLGAHVEALAQIKQGLPVSADVLAVAEADFEIPYLNEKFFDTIANWNEKDETVRDGENSRENFSEGLMTFIAEEFGKDTETDVVYARFNKEGYRAMDMKGELLRAAVSMRLSQLEKQAGGLQG
ncbi:MAG: hypothetical protein U1C50_03200 [Patescibacteria group bacterium]|nr:hypothetical protein [Candidatus Beckwithbacteria bacterium]MDZ4229239.1 hypothetical protein [Patescibacteria group bacterium]